MYRVFLKAAATMAACAFFLSPFVSSARAVEVYLFKGAGDFSFINSNMHFSRGLEKIARQMNSEGIHAEVRRFGAVEDALATIRRRKPESVAFIGHSMGALASMAMARRMRAEGIRVAYLGLIDIPGPVGVAGDNVEWVENYYSINPVYGLLTNASSHPNAKNIHVSGYIHNRMDDSPRVQNGMLDAVRKVHAAERGGMETTPQVAPPAIQPAPQMPVIEPPVDPWAGHRVATIDVRHVNNQPQHQYQAPVAETVSAGTTHDPSAVLPGVVDPVTTASIGPVPKIGVGETGTAYASGYSASPEPVRPASQTIQRGR
ncbi:MAG: hypothetical protein JJ891_14445 [Rhizobiaceae bacterium]|nr:hypothetical protein [Rhizobiaceae bacterium]